MQTCLVEVPSKDEKKEHDIVNPALRCIMMLQENSNIQISANWWKNTASSQNLKLLGDFLLGLSHSRDFLKTWPLTLRSASLRVFVDAPVVSTWKSIISLTKLGHPASRPEPFRSRGKNDECAHLTGELKTLYMKTVGSSQRPSFHRQQRSSREIDVMKRTDRPVRGKKLSFCSSSIHQHFTRTHNTAAPERQDFYATGKISRLDPIGFVLYVQTHQRVAISAALIPAGLREADLSASLWASGPCAIPPSLRLNKKVVIPDRYIHSCLFQMMWATLFMKHSKRKKCLCLSSCKAKRESPDSGVCLLFLAARGCWCSRVQLLSSPSAFCCIMPQKKNKKEHWSQSNSSVSVHLHLHLWHSFTQHFCPHTVQLHCRNTYAVLSLQGCSSPVSQLIMKSSQYKSINLHVDR